ncbi:MAG: GNAT family N-acetyltransferase [Candidatus Tumulicola sp.]
MFAQLGYPNDAATIERRLHSCTDDSSVWLAWLEKRIVGLIAVHISEHLLDGTMAEIAALVVDEETRGQGIGAGLLRAAESWAIERGTRRIRVRSNVIRADAHRFYEREGYAPVKDQRVFEKRS